MDVPGNQGWAFAGDKSLEFAKSPLLFVEKRLKTLNSKIFYARALNKPTVFVTSSNGVKDILLDNWADFSFGYRDFGYMSSLYGEMLIFSDGDEARRLRDIMKTIFCPSNCHHYAEEIEKVASEFLTNLHARQSVSLYQHLKEYTTALCLYLFLDLDWRTDPTKFNNVKAISTVHWHGLYSVPVSVKIKGWSSSFGKAMEARDYLLAAIQHKICSNSSCGSFLAATQEAGFATTDEAKNHLLLFVSALIPKALSSLLTSFCLALSGDSKHNLRKRAQEDQEFLDCILMEVQRLWPPFLGGRRISTKDVVIDGYKVPANTPVAYLSWFANRDTSVFPNAAQFKPERWIDKKDQFHSTVWTFGGGPRCCVGINFINHILRISCKLLLETYDWSADGVEGDAPYKTLPVARPKDEILFKFTKRDT